MGLKHKSRQSEKSVAVGTTIGVGICILMWILVSGVLAGMITNEYVAEDLLQWIVPCVQLIVSFAGSLFAGKITSGNKGVASAVCAAIYFAAMAGITILVFDGNFVGVLPTAASIALGCVLSILLNLKRSSRSVKGRRIKIGR